MRTKIALILVLTLSIVFTSLVSAYALEGKTYFIGLWQGVDPLDGSENLISITLNKDGTFNIIGSESYWTFCDGGRGIVKGTGHLIYQGTLDHLGILEADETLTCFSGGTADYTEQFIPDVINGTLKEVYPEDSTQVILILHRIDTRVVNP